MLIATIYERTAMSQSILLGNLPTVSNLILIEVECERYY